MTTSLLSWSTRKPSQTKSLKIKPFLIMGFSNKFSLLIGFICDEFGESRKWLANLNPTVVRLRDRLIFKVWCSRWLRFFHLEIFCQTFFINIWWCYIALSANYPAVHLILPEKLMGYYYLSRETSVFIRNNLKNNLAYSHIFLHHNFTKSAATC